MCAKLGITIMAASSPQAKGRVERHHGTHQDRLIKKMRLRGIVEYEAANRYLDEEYLAEHNERFACEPAAAAGFHQALPRGTELRGVFCCEYERVVSNDRVVRFENRCLQLKPKRNQGVGAGARVTVQQWRDESLQVRFDGHEIEHDVIATPTPQLRTKPAPQQRPGGRAQAGGGPPLAASCVTEKTGCEYIRGLWKCRVGWKAWKISRGSSTGFEERWMVFHPSHRPLEIATRFPQFHSPDDDDISPTNKKHKGTLLSSYRGGHFYWALTESAGYS